MDKDDSKKIGTMDLVLVLVAGFLLVFVSAVLLIFYKTGSEPSTLVASVFAICGCEAGIMGWIKTNKDKQPTTEKIDLTDREEPDDVGIQ